MYRYDVREELGDGTFGTVFLARDRATREEVAIKQMKREYCSWRECVDNRELMSLKSLSSHPSIVCLYEVIREVDNQLYLVFEYMPDGNLYDFIKRCTPITSNPHPSTNLLSEAKIQSITKQILQGLAYLHAKGFVHRDIKPENILLRGDTCKVADFGLAREQSSPYECTEYVSTRWYRAPEVLLRSPRYGSPVDLYAVGCIIAELYNRVPLFPGDSEIDQLDRMINVLGLPDEETCSLATKLGFSFEALADELVLKNKPIPPMPIEIAVRAAPPRAISLMKGLLQWNPECRLLATEALSHGFVSPGVPRFGSPKFDDISSIAESFRANRSPKLVTPGNQRNFRPASAVYTRPSSSPFATERQPFGYSVPHYQQHPIHSTISPYDLPSTRGMA